MSGIMHILAPRRRAILAIGAGALAILAVPGVARAHHGVAPRRGRPDHALRPIQAPVELAMALPAFGPQHGALIRAAIESPAFQAALDGATGGPPPAMPTGFAPDLARARQARDAFLRLANPRMTADERDAFLPDAELPNLFEDVPISDGPPAVVVRGTDVVDRLAYWLAVAIDLARPLPADMLAEGAVFRSLRAQLLLGYAAAPSLAGLSEQGRHDFATWLFLNTIACMLKMDFAGRANNNDGSSAAEVAMRSDIRAALSGHSLELDRLVLDRRGLRRA